MTGIILNKDFIDAAGRRLVLSDNIYRVYYYDSSQEQWDKSPSSASWYTENKLPSDIFDYETVDTARWKDSSTSRSSGSGIVFSEGALFSVAREEGVCSLSSEGKWSLEGDFEIRLYPDWDSYYNEYRGVTSFFLKIFFDNSHAFRLGFVFDLEGFKFAAEKAVGRDLRYFDWKQSGSSLDFEHISEAHEFIYLKVVRQGDTLYAYVSDGEQEIQVGDAVSSSFFEQPLKVEIGVENKEYNTSKQKFKKFFVQGEIAEEVEFYSSSRGEKASFPDQVLLAVDDYSLSIIDSSTQLLWARCFLGPEYPASSSADVAANNGVIYLTSGNSVVSYDFVNDRVYRFKSNTVEVSNEPLSLRNSSLGFSTHISSTGSFLGSSYNSISSRSYQGVDVVAAGSSDGYLTVFKPLLRGASNFSAGMPVNCVDISDLGNVYWGSYSGEEGRGSISYYSNMNSIVTNSGSQNLVRSGYFNKDTSFRIYDEDVRVIDSLSRNGADLISFGTSSSVGFIGFSPGVPFNRSTSYGLASAANANPFKDPLFEKYLGIDWFISYNTFHSTFKVHRKDNIEGLDTSGVQLLIENVPLNSYYEEDSSVGLEQAVDLTGIDYVFFDFKLESTSPRGNNTWDFEVLVDNTVVKSYSDTDADITVAPLSVDTSSFNGECVFKVRLRVVKDSSFSSIGDCSAYVSNFRVSLSPSDCPILNNKCIPVKEVLTQYDAAGHKIYFSSPGGYGAIDLDDNSLDYFQEIEGISPGNEIISGDFSEVDNV